MFLHAANPAVQSGTYPADLSRVLSATDLDHAKAEIETWQSYQPSPLWRLDGLAAESGLGAIHYKDESERFGLASFKALGGAYAVKQLIGRLGHRDITVCCATDGNHGRSVAWGAKRFGCRCRIYIHATVSEGRKRAIEAFGAEVIRTEGNYDDSVRHAAGDAEANGWYVVSDTSYPGYVTIPKDVMAGYMLMAHEAFESLDEPPTHIFIQGGVGGLAAAVLATSWQRYGENRPRFVIVEPDKAACIFESIKAGKPVPVEGDLDTLMAGLACGEVSILAFELFAAGTHDVLVIDDEAATDMMIRLASPAGNDPAIVAGESATCGLAAAIRATADDALASALELNKQSWILVFGTEGDTDPELYRKITGASGDEIRSHRYP